MSSVLAIATCGLWRLLQQNHALLLTGALLTQVMDSLSHPALLLVDGVSSIGGLDFQMDAWKVDMAVTGSQKALSLPTGLALVAASPKVPDLAASIRHYRELSMVRCSSVHECDL